MHWMSKELLVLIYGWNLKTPAFVDIWRSWKVAGCWVIVDIHSADTLSSQNFSWEQKLKLGVTQLTQGPGFRLRGRLACGSHVSAWSSKCYKWGRRRSIAYYEHWVHCAWIGRILLQRKVYDVTTVQHIMMAEFESRPCPQKLEVKVNVNGNILSNLVIIHIYHSINLINYSCIQGRGKSMTLAQGHSDVKIKTCFFQKPGCF